MTASMPDVSILIVSYNTRELTTECIASVIEQTSDISFEIIVVDNASTDGSADEMARRFPLVHLVRSQENLGFGRANNLAASHARGDLILLLNPDTLVRNNAIAELVSFARKTPYAKIWGGRTTFADGSLNPSSCWRFMSPWSLFCSATGLARVFCRSDLFNHEEYGDWKRDTEREVDFVSGCCLLIERHLWEALGGFDPRFHMYAEEADLCFRARKMGALPRVTPLATIVHYGGASETVRAGKVKRLLAGKMTFIKIHWSTSEQFLARQLLHLHVLVRLVGNKVLTKLTRSSSHHAAASDWYEVWKDRCTWNQGYPTSDSTASS